MGHGINRKHIALAPRTSGMCRAPAMQTTARPYGSLWTAVLLRVGACPRPHELAHGAELVNSPQQVARAARPLFLVGLSPSSTIAMNANLRWVADSRCMGRIGIESDLHVPVFASLDHSPLETRGVPRSRRSNRATSDAQSNNPDVSPCR